MLTALGTESAELTMLEGQAWGSWHLYDFDPDEYLRVVAAVLPPVVKELSDLSLVDRFFFIRYADERGHHLRLRFRLRESGIEDVGKVTQVVSAIAARCGLTAVLQHFELEIERYGGLSHLHHSLEFFCLSSSAALEWSECNAREPRSRQLTTIMGLLTDQALSLARNLNELALLLDYYAAWQPRMELTTQHGDRVFESQTDKLVGLLQLHIEATLSADQPQGLLVEGAQALSVATLGLLPEVRTELLRSQMHMTANRMSLRNPEESYVTQILKRSLNELIRRESCCAALLDAQLARQQPNRRLEGLVNDNWEARCPRSSTVNR